MDQGGVCAEADGEQYCGGSFGSPAVWLFWLTECQASSLVALWGDGEEGQQKELGGGCCSGSKAQMAVI